MLVRGHLLDMHAEGSGAGHGTGSAWLPSQLLSVSGSPVALAYFTAKNCCAPCKMLWFQEVHALHGSPAISLHRLAMLSGSQSAKSMSKQPCIRCSPSACCCAAHASSSSPCDNHAAA
jgi:hypothetical protein